MVPESAAVQRDHQVWWSPALDRKMELLWFGDGGIPVLLFPTSMGSYHQNEDFGLVGALKPQILRGQLQVCCVDSVDEESWYAKTSHPRDRAQRHDRYDAYLRDEVAPYVRDRSGSRQMDVGGASFGGYHAINFAFRYPELVRRAISLSGMFDIHRYLDGYWDETCYYHCPIAFVPNLPPEWVERISRVGIVLATGEHDTLHDDNQSFAKTLESKGIPAHVEFWPGVFGHDWPYWREHLPRFLS